MNDEQRILAFRFSHIDLPAYATDCEPWEWHDDSWRRYFTVKEWNVGEVRVCVLGEQTHHGHVARWLYVGGDDTFTTSSRRHLTKTLEDAGDLLDSLG